MLMNKSHAHAAKAVLLIMQAIKAKQENDLEQVRTLMNEAQQILENIGEANPLLSISREFLVVDYSNKESWHDLDAMIMKAYEYYTSQDRTPFQISMLIQSVHLALRVGDREKASLHLDELKSKLNIITDMDMGLPVGLIGSSGKELILKWQEEVSRLEQMLANLH